VCSRGGMILTAEQRTDRIQTCPQTAVSTRNLTQTGVKLKISSGRRLTAWATARRFAAWYFSSLLAQYHSSVTDSVRPVIGENVQLDCCCLLRHGGTVERGKERLFLCDRRLGGRRSRTWSYWKEENIRLCRDSNKVHRSWNP